MNEYIGRIRLFASLLSDKNIDAAVFFNERHFDYDIAYFTGLSIKNSFLIITKKGNSYFFASEMEYEKAARFLPSSIKPKKLSSLDGLAAFVLRGRPGHIGLSYNLSYKMFKKIKSALKQRAKNTRITDISGLSLKQRAIKTKQEIKTIKKSYNIASEILSKAILAIKRGKLRSESEIRDFLISKTKESNCSLAFEPIVASGKNSSMPHYLAPEKKLNKGFCIIDFGVKYKNYCSDITRTIYIGKISEHERKAYSLLLSAQKRAISSLKQGLRFSDLDAQVRADLGKYSKNFIHGLGHGLGLYIHELPSLHAKTKDKLTENMIFTIEPGIYFPGKFGIRIEDGILFSKNKAIILSRLPKELTIIEKTKKAKR